MKRSQTITVSVLVALIAGATADPAAAQSFNCRNATHADEVEICRDRLLSDLDEQLASVYAEKRQRLGQAQRQKLKSDQRAWLRQRRQCSNDNECIFDLYEQRLKQISAIGLSPGSLVAETLPWGSRAGMEVTVVRKEGIGTSRAIIYVRHTRKNAWAFCVGSGRDYSESCIRGALREMGGKNLINRVTADCERKVWTTLGGTKYSFHGKATSQDDAEELYIIKQAGYSEPLGHGNASGYYVALEAFKMLCPYSF